MAAVKADGCDASADVSASVLIARALGPVALLTRRGREQSTLVEGAVRQELLVPRAGKLKNIGLCSVGFPKIGETLHS